MTRVQFDVKIVSAGRRNRQLTQTVATDLLGDASNVVVSEIGANLFRVTITLDSASAYLVDNVKNFVSRPDFANRLFALKKLAHLYTYIKKILYIWLFHP